MNLANLVIGSLLLYDAYLVFKCPCSTIAGCSYSIFMTTSVAAVAAVVISNSALISK